MNNYNNQAYHTRVPPTIREECPARKYPAHMHNRSTEELGSSPTVYKSTKYSTSKLRSGSQLQKGKSRQWSECIRKFLRKKQNMGESRNKELKERRQIALEELECNEGKTPPLGFRIEQVCRNMLLSPFSSPQTPIIHSARTGIHIAGGAPTTGSTRGPSPRGQIFGGSITINIKRKGQRGYMAKGGRGFGDNMCNACSSSGIQRPTRFDIGDRHFPLQPDFHSASMSNVQTKVNAYQRFLLKSKKQTQYLKKTNEEILGVGGVTPNSSMPKGSVQFVNILASPTPPIQDHPNKFVFKQKGGINEYVVHPPPFSQTKTKSPLNPQFPTERIVSKSPPNGKPIIDKKRKKDLEMKTFMKRFEVCENKRLLSGHKTPTPDLHSPAPINNHKSEFPELSRLVKHDLTSIPPKFELSKWKFDNILLKPREKNEILEKENMLASPSGKEHIELRNKSESPFSEEGESPSSRGNLGSEEINNKYKPKKGKFKTKTPLNLITLAPTGDDYNLDYGKGEREAPKYAHKQVTRGSSRGVAFDKGNKGSEGYQGLTNNDLQYANIILNGKNMIIDQTVERPINIIIDSKYENTESSLHRKSESQPMPAIQEALNLDRSNVKSPPTICNFKQIGDLLDSNSIEKHPGSVNKPRHREDKEENGNREDRGEKRGKKTKVTSKTQRANPPRTAATKSNPKQIEVKDTSTPKCIRNPINPYFDKVSISPWGIEDDIHL